MDYEKRNRNELIDTENKLMVTGGGGGGGGGEMGENGERDQEVQTSSYKNSHGDAKHCIGNTVNNIATAIYGVRCVLDPSEWSLCKVYKCPITETSTIWYATVISK